MKTLVLSSEVTFVPNNYEELVIPLADSSHVCGLVLFKNRSFDLLAKALALILLGAAPRFGWTLIKNFFGFSSRRKIRAYQKHNKNVLVFSSAEDPKLIAWIKNEKIDLVLNARTRYLFKKELLQAPRLGCINIHHGLLPLQRGVMCDFWAHLENTPFGFSIHQMTEKIDAGEILEVVEVSTDRTSYLRSILAGSKLEAKVCKEVLEEIAQADGIAGRENKRTEHTVYRKNPRFKDFFKMKAIGIKI